MDYDDIARYTHIAAGTAALATFWTSAVMRKGTPAHRAIGRVYMVAMIGVIVTALVLALAAFLAGKVVTTVFLVYLVLITATPALLAWRAVRMKHSYSEFTAGPHKPLAALNLVAGAAVLALGLHFDVPLLYGMSVVGLLIGTSMLRFAARVPAKRDWWLAQHYGAIVGCGVATHIAFLNLGLQRLIPGDFSEVAQYAAWFGPVVAGLLAGRWLDYRYLKRAVPA